MIVLPTKNIIKVMRPYILDLNTELKSLKPRLPDANKGDFGRVLIIGGDVGMSGSVHMAAESAARAGCGLVTVITHPSHAAMINITRPEIMCYGLDADNSNHTEKFDFLLAKADVIIVGPGLGMSDWGQGVFTYIMAHKLNKPMIIDADALNILASNNSAPCNDGKIPINTNYILTPHPGEAARLLNITIQQIQHDRLAAIKNLQQKFGCTVVLKGAGTLIKSLDPIIYICNAGNPGMASGGMGDVLSGVIGGLAAQGLDACAAARLAVIAHATAGDILATEEGQIGILASDLIPKIRKILNAK